MAANNKLQTQSEVEHLIKTLGMIYQITQY